MCVISTFGTITRHRDWWGAKGPADGLPVGAHPDEMLLGTLAGVSVTLTASAYRIGETRCSRPRATMDLRARTRTLLMERQMSPFRSSGVVVVLGVAIALLASASAPVRAGRQLGTLPASLSDAELWALSGRLSEANGVFVSRSGSPDNLLSNENSISSVAAELASRVKPGGVYLGVGPEQNFTYIAATRPRIAFITDIRRGNLQLHLVYKALFGLSATRSELVARLFSRRTVPVPTPTAKTTAAELMRAVGDAPAMTDTEYRANVAAIETYLTRTHAPGASAPGRATLRGILCLRLRSIRV